jgi:hypothetical protein
MWVSVLMVRLCMRDEEPEHPEAPDRRINWSIYVIVMGSSCLLGGLLAPMRILPVMSGGWGFALAVALGVVVGAVVNCARPRYGSSKGRLRSFYDFLLRQMSPPD